MNTRPKSDYTGMRFGRWVTIRFNASPNKSGRDQYWICRCDCGAEKTVRLANLKNGCSQSCGCSAHIKHGLCGTSLYKAWDSMKQRCFWKKHKSYKDYGGRGIKACLFIRESPSNLAMVIGKKPSQNMSIDRIDNEGHYSCGHCRECKRRKWKKNLRWATWKQQSRNRSNNLLVTINGVEKCAADWTRLASLDQLSMPD